MAMVHIGETGQQLIFCLLIPLEKMLSLLSNQVEKISPHPFIFVEVAEQALKDYFWSTQSQ